MKIKQKYPNEITDLIKNELTLHPQAELVDIYKLFYQDYFGCGHFFSDQKDITKYLTIEINEFSLNNDTNPEIQEIYCFNNFIRVDIRWINCGHLALHELADLFWKSSRIKLKQPLSWINHWQNICEIIARDHLLNCQTAKNELEDFAQHKNSVHHSELYRQKYQPHYRIIHRDFWKL